jgi:hypothetical protein
MLADIQNAGGIGALKKVDRSQIRDRSQAQVGGGGDSGSAAPPPGAPTPPGGAPNMADALAAALQRRKGKVSKSGKLSSPEVPHKIPFDTDTLQMMKTTMMIGMDEIRTCWDTRCQTRWMREEMFHVSVCGGSECVCGICFFTSFTKAGVQYFSRSWMWLKLQKASPYGVHGVGYYFLVEVPYALLLQYLDNRGGDGILQLIE